MKRHIKEILIDEIELDDLDMIVEDELLGVNPEGHDCEWIRDIENHHNWEEHLSIKKLEDTIKELKEKGANYIQIDSNGDHRAYILTGVYLEVVSEKEVKEREIEKLETAIRNNEMGIQFGEEELVKKQKNLKEQKEKLEELNQTK